MDSLNNLRDSLDSSSTQSANDKTQEQRLTADFKSAALHLTALYRTSLASSRAARDSGYIQALSDILEVVHSRSSPRHQALAEGGIGGGESSQDDTSSDDDAQRERTWLARYLRARLDTMRLEEEVEDTAEDTDTQTTRRTVSDTAPPVSSSSSASTTATLVMSSPLPGNSESEATRRLHSRNSTSPSRSPSLFTFRAHDFLTHSPVLASSNSAVTAPTASINSSPISAAGDASRSFAPSRPYGGFCAPLKARSTTAPGNSTRPIMLASGKGKARAPSDVIDAPVGGGGGRPRSLSPVLEENLSLAADRRRHLRNGRTRSRPHKDRIDNDRAAHTNVVQNLGEVERDDRGGRRRGSAAAEPGEERSRKKRRDRGRDREDATADEGMLEA